MVNRKVNDGKHQLPEVGWVEIWSDSLKLARSGFPNAGMQPTGLGS